MKGVSANACTTLEELIDTIPTQIWQMFGARTYGYANAAHAAFLGKARSDIEGQDACELFPAPEAARLIENNRRVFSTGTPTVSEEWLTNGGGDVRLLRIIRTPEANNHGGAQFLACMAEDISDPCLTHGGRTAESERNEDEAQDRSPDREDALWGTINSLVRLAESRDDLTGGHLRRLSESCRIVASVLSLNSVYSERMNYEFIINLQQASLLHDIGKAGIPDSILLKPGKLTREEFEQMKMHAAIGARTLQESYPHSQNHAILSMAIDIALAHHERWDGKGYPNSLKGDQIPLSAQIVAICDVYDALRSPRSYKSAYSHEKSLAEIRRECGTHFNPAVCDAFFNCSEELRHIYDSFPRQ
jgi:hypothetical protein